MINTITPTNISDEVYDSLKQAAAANYRSVEHEAIACIERTLLPTKISHADQIARARGIREGLKAKFTAEDFESH